MVWRQFAFAAALGAGVYLSAIVVLIVQGVIAGWPAVSVPAWTRFYVTAAGAVGGLLIMAIGLRLLDVRQVRVVSFLPALIVTPLFVGLADAMRAWWP
jgi:uncharacterized membrane protein YqgA involved in biofilm formation